MPNVSNHVIHECHPPAAAVYCKIGWGQNKHDFLFQKINHFLEEGLISPFFFFPPLRFKTPSTEQNAGGEPKKQPRPLSFQREEINVLSSTSTKTRPDQAEGSQNAQCDGAQFENQVGWLEGAKKMTTREEST